MIGKFTSAQSEYGEVNEVDAQNIMLYLEETPDDTNNMM